MECREQLNSLKALRSRKSVVLVFGTALFSETVACNWTQIEMFGYTNKQKVAILRKSMKPIGLFVNPFPIEVLTAMSHNDIDSSGMDGMYSQLHRIEEEIRYRNYIGICDLPFMVTVEDFKTIVSQNDFHPEMLVGKFRFLYFSLLFLTTISY